MANAKAIGAKYLKSEILKPLGDTVVTIDSVDIHEFKEQDGSSTRKLVLNFVEDLPPWPLNKVNTNTICDIHGDDYEDWSRKQLLLVNETCLVGVEMKGCIRVREVE